MKWAEFVVLASRLVEQESEGAKRSAASRAYYGAFNEARRLLEAHGVTIDNGRAHDRVWRAFRAGDRATAETRVSWRLVGELGGTLRVLRNHADYADAVQSLDRQAAEAVVSARRILVMLDELEFS
jgi:uncharacterized protein (UPF0332 family)